MNYTTSETTSHPTHDRDKDLEGIERLPDEKNDALHRAAMLYDALDHLVKHVGRHPDSLPNRPLNPAYQRAVVALSEADDPITPDAEEGDG